MICITSAENNVIKHVVLFMTDKIIYQPYLYINSRDVARNTAIISRIRIVPVPEKNAATPRVTRAMRMTNDDVVRTAT